MIELDDNESKLSLFKETKYIYFNFCCCYCCFFPNWLLNVYALQGPLQQVLIFANIESISSATYMYKRGI